VEGKKLAEEKKKENQHKLEEENRSANSGKRKAEKATWSQEKKTSQTEQGSDSDCLSSGVKRADDKRNQKKGKSGHSLGRERASGRDERRRRNHL
jgi:hypothetical protein